MGESKRERYMRRIEARCEVLRARIHPGNRNHIAHVLEWQMELNALEWALEQIAKQPTEAN